jgi:hypothetical protein
MQCYSAPPFPLQFQERPCSNLNCTAHSAPNFTDTLFSTFVDEPPSVARGGNGVVVPGCPLCKKRFGTTPQFLDHLTDDVLPAVLNGLSAGKVGGAIKADSVRNPRESVSRTSVSPNANS